MVTVRRARKARTDLPKRFYAQALTEAERSDLPLALEVDGVDQEIAVLRLRLRSMLEERPDDLTLMFKGIELLTKAVATRYRLSKRAERDLAASMANVVRSLGDLWPDNESDA